jgi:hypothetical protein
MVLIKETREGWPMLTVGTEVNGDSKSTNERGPSLVGSLDSLCSYNRFLPCHGCFSQPSTKYKIPHRTLFTLLVPSPSKLGRQACWVACLIVSGSNNVSFSIVKLCFCHCTVE